MISSAPNAHLADPNHGGRYAAPYDMYAEMDEAMAPRVTSSRQKDMQKNRMSRFQDRGMGGLHANYMKQGGAGAGLQQQAYPQDVMMFGYGARRDRSNSINSLLHGYNELPLDFQMYDGQDYDINDVDEAGGGRSRSNTLLSVGSIYDDKSRSGANPSRRGSGGTRNRTTSEEWGNLAQATTTGVSPDMFKDSETTHPQFVQSGAGMAAGSVVLPHAGAVATGPGLDGGRKRRVSIDLTNYFGGGWGGGADDGDAEAGSAQAFETKRTRNNSISEILSSII